MSNPALRLLSISHLILFVILVSAASGCSLTNPKKSKSLAGLTEPEGQKVPQETCIVELHPGGAKPSRMQLPISDSTTVQQALVESRAVKKFKKMKIHVLRIDEATGRKVKMGVEYLSDKRHVVPHYDYVLRANDRVVITEDNSSALESVIGSLTKIVGGG